jgi:hypothetical protein
MGWMHREDDGLSNVPPFSNFFPQNNSEQFFVTFL